MRRPDKGSWSKAALEIAALMLMLTAFATAAKGDQDKSATAPAKDSQYVGAETCKGRHEDIFKNFEKTPHWKTTLNKTHPARPVLVLIAERWDAPDENRQRSGGGLEGMIDTKASLWRFLRATANQTVSTMASSLDFSKVHLCAPAFEKGE